MGSAAVVHPRVLHAEHVGRLSPDLTDLSDEEGVASELLPPDDRAQDVALAAASTGRPARPTSRTSCPDIVTTAPVGSDAHHLAAPA